MLILYLSDPGDVEGELQTPSCLFDADRAPLASSLQLSACTCTYMRSACVQSRELRNQNYAPAALPAA